VKALVLFILLLVAAAAGGYWWYENNMAPKHLPVAVKAVESQLRLDSAAVGFLNLEFAKKLEKYLLFQEPKKVITENLQKDYGLFFYQLKNSGLNLNDQLDYVVAGVIADDTPEYAIAMFGQFNLANMNKRLESNKYKIKEQKHNNRTYWEVTAYNEETCRYEQPVSYFWNNQLLLIGSKWYFPKLLDAALNNKGAAGSAIHRYKLAVGSITQPKKLSKGFDGALAIMLDQAAKHADPLSSIDLEVQLAVSPPSMQLVSVARHKNDQWANGVVNGYNSWKASHAAEINKHADLKTLMDIVTVSPNAGQLTVSTNLNLEQVNSLENIPKQFFSVYVPKITSRNPGEVKEETLEKSEIKKYLAKVEIDSIPIFKKESKEKLSHAVITGPFAAYLNGVRISESGSAEVNVGMISAPIPNLFFEDVNPKGVGSIRFEDVMDKEGKTLLENKDCAVKNTDNHAKFRPTFRNISLDVEFGRNNATLEVAQSSVSVPLKQGVKANEISAIKGVLDLHVPDQVDVVQMLPEGDSATYSNGAFRLKLTEFNGSSVNYEVGGDKSLLVDVRGKNANDEYLKRIGAISMQRLFDGGEIGAWDFAGVPKSIELVVAGKKISESYTFEINSLNRHELIPSYVKNDITLSNAKDFSKNKFNPVSSDKCSETEIELSKGEMKPFLLCIKYPFQAWDETSYSGVFELLGPITPEISNNLSAVTFVLNSVALSDAQGEVKTHEIMGKQVSNFTLSGTGNKSSPQIIFPAPEGVKPAEMAVKAVKGRLLVNLVKKLEQATLDTNNIGQVVYTKSGLKLVYEGFGPEAHYIRIYGDKERIVNVYGIDEKDREIKANFPKLDYPKNRKEGYTLLIADVHGKPTKLVVELAQSLDQLAYDFKRNNK